MKYTNSYGFTLVEMLVATALVITSATIIVSIIAITFRNSNDSSSQEKLRQSGTAALSQVTGMIRFADSFEGAYIGEDKVECQVPNSDSSPSVDSIKIISQGVERTIACNDDDVLTIDGQPLWDPINVVPGPNGCNISCTQQTAADPPLINITLSLQTPTSDTSLQENSAQILDFSQSVRMANLNQ